MVRNIFITTVSRILIAILSLVILGVNAHYLGAEALGSISLLILGITINMMLSNIFCGSAIVYLSSRRPIIQLFLTGISWTLISCFTGTWLQMISGLLPDEWFRDTLILSFMFSLGGLLQNMLLGTKRIKWHNASALLQQIILAGVLCYEIFIEKNVSLNAFVSALYISWVVTLILLLLTADSKLRKQKFIPFRELIKEILQYGLIIQLTNLVQALNYRVCFYFIEKMFDRKTLGFFSAGTQLAEGIWIIARSLATVQYSHLSNNKNEEYANRVTISLSKFSFIISLFGAGFLLLLPTSVFTAYLGSDFIMIKTVLATLLPGILFFSASMLLSHYFAARAEYKINLGASFTGLIAVLISAWYFVPLYAEAGAGIATSISHFCNSLFLLFGFLKISKSNILAFLPNRNDFSELKRILKRK